MLPQPSAPPQQPPQPAGVVRRIWKYCFMEAGDPKAEKKADALLVAASVIAAMNFQAALSPPGGIYQQAHYENGTMVYEAGHAIGAYIYPYEYRRFSIANTISFGFSMSTMFLFLCGLSLHRRIFSILLTLSMFATITATTYSYKYAMEATTPDHDPNLQAQWHFVNRLVNGALFTWFGVAGLAIVIFVVQQIKPLCSVQVAYPRVTRKT